MITKQVLDTVLDIDAINIRMSTIPLNNIVYEVRGEETRGSKVINDHAMGNLCKIWAIELEYPIEITSGFAEVDDIIQSYAPYAYIEHDEEEKYFEEDSEPNCIFAAMDHIMKEIK